MPRLEIVQALRTYAGARYPIIAPVRVNVDTEVDPMPDDNPVQEARITRVEIGVRQLVPHEVPMDVSQEKARRLLLRTIYGGVDKRVERIMWLARDAAVDPGRAGRNLEDIQHLADESVRLMRGGSAGDE